MPHRRTSGPARDGATAKRDALKAVLRPPLVLRSLGVAAVIGTVLNLINQGDALWGGTPLHAGKICLTYVVPFLVASYGAWAALAAGPEP